MSRLRWDQIGERFYEAGIDRGVLYLSDSSGVAWSGLVSVEESFDDSTDAAYLDGVKRRDHASIGDFAASLKAFTYPDEFLEYEGVLDLGNGLYVDDQAPKPFGLSYRTRVGNDVDGLGYGYRIHLLYNLTASADAVNYETADTDGESTEFSWSLTGLPEKVPGFRPTAHVIFDSRELTPTLLAGLESTLYGDEDQKARLPSIEELVQIVSTWDPRTIVPDTVGGVGQLIDGGNDLTPSLVAGVYYMLPNTALVETDIPGFYTLGPRVPSSPGKIIGAPSPGQSSIKTYSAGSPSTVHTLTIHGGAP